MIDLIAATLFGLAAHQADRVVRDWPTQWEMLGRYIIGGLTVILSFSMILARLNRSALRDGLLAICGAFGAVGVGVALARWFDEMK